MPSITNITTTGGLTFQIEVQPTYQITRDWSAFNGYNSNTYSNTYWKAELIKGSLYIPTQAGSMYVSTDGGISWSPLKNGVRPVGILSAGRYSYVLGFTGNISSRLVGINNNTNIPLLYSNNGFNWNPGLANQNSIRLGIAYSGVVFVGVGPFYDSSRYSNTFGVYTSTDGITWTIIYDSRVTYSTSEDLQNITFGESEGYVYFERRFSWFYTSTAGISWEGGILPTRDWLYKQYYLLAYVPNYWIIVQPDTGYVIYRVKGQQSVSFWKISYGTVMPIGTYNMLAYNNDTIVIVGNNGRVVTASLNGFNDDPESTVWSVQTSGTNDNLVGVMWEGTKFIANGNKGVIITSSDGYNWVTRRSTAFEQQAITYPDVTAGFNQGTYLLLMDVKSSAAYVSTNDGLTFTQSTVYFNNVDCLWINVTYGLNLYVAVLQMRGTLGKVMAYSNDGINWTVGYGESSTDSYAKFIMYADTGPYKFIVGGFGQSRGIFTYQTLFGSTNGVNWGQIGNSVNIPQRAVTYGVWTGSYYVISGQTGIIYSVTGNTWTNVVIQNNPSDNSYFIGIAFNGSVLVTVETINNTARLYTSTNIINWTLRLTVNNNDPISINYTNSKFILCLSSGSVLFSSNGINWDSSDDSDWPVTEAINNASGNYLFGRTFYLKIT